MEKPDQRLLEADLLSAEFRTGVVKEYWNLAGTDVLPEQPEWPNRVFWIAAAPRPNAPARFYVHLDLAGYRSVPPTGTFWNPVTKSTLDFSLRPKGKADSRVAKVFRTDWENGRAFYHPYDRLAAQGHTDWPKDQPHLLWTINHTIVDYLQEIHTLLNHGDYIGI
jgi:hypothetical protein